MSAVPGKLSAWQTDRRTNRQMDRFSALHRLNVHNYIIKLQNDKITSHITAQYKASKLVGHFCKHCQVVPYFIASIETYTKCGQPKSNLIGHCLKLVWKWPVANCYFVHCIIASIQCITFPPHCAKRTKEIQTKHLHIHGTTSPWFYWTVPRSNVVHPGRCLFKVAGSCSIVNHSYCQNSQYFTLLFKLKWRSRVFCTDLQTSYAEREGRCAVDFE